MKPGQFSTSRDFYQGATHEKPDGQKMLTNYGRFQSIYDQNQNSNVTKGVHRVPDKSNNNMLGYEYTHHPKLFNSTKIGRDMQRNGQQIKNGMTLSDVGACVTMHTNPAAQWSSTYRQTTAASAVGERLVSRRPLWSINRTAYSSGRGNYKTEFQETIGKMGHNPRDVLNKDSTAQPKVVNELTMGTNKVTQHMPGYSGFLPQTDINERALK